MLPCDGSWEGPTSTCAFKDTFFWSWLSFLSFVFYLVGSGVGGVWTWSAENSSVHARPLGYFLKLSSFCIWSLPSFCPLTSQVFILMMIYVFEYVSLNNKYYCFLYLCVLITSPVAHPSGQVAMRKHLKTKGKTQIQHMRHEGLLGPGTGIQEQPAGQGCQLLSWTESELLLWGEGQRLCVFEKGYVIYDCTTLMVC